MACKTLLIKPRRIYDKKSFFVHKICCIYFKMKRQRDRYDAAAHFILKGWAKMKWSDKIEPMNEKKNKTKQTNGSKHYSQSR